VKKLSFIFLALGIAACSGEESGAVKCNQECGGALLNNPGGRCDQYDPGRYASGTATCRVNDAGWCVVDTSQCVDILRVSEFEKCSGSGQGDCEEGFECFPIEPEITVCMEPCQDNDPTSCTAGDIPRICVGLSQTMAYCLKQTATLYDPCYPDNFSWCEEGQGSCRSTRTNLIGEWVEGRGYEDELKVDWRCMPVCDPSGKNNPDYTCTNGDECLGAPVRNITATESAANPGNPTQFGGDYRECDTTVTNQTTQCSVGYECVTLVFSNGTVRDICTMFEHWCGKNVPFCSQFNQAGYQVCLESGSCDMAPDYNLCNVVDSDPNVPDASSHCWGAIQFDGESLYPICVGICEDKDFKNELGDDLLPLDCGAGYICGAPPAGSEIFYTHQSEIDSTMAEDATCTEDSECATEKDFKCFSPRQGDPKSCNRPTKVCTVSANPN